ncbi:MAG: hypothetical protein IJF62_02235, partial [Firmicutes bacterium]|nr:hypothetical protein [Bacillota bacterium]
MEILPLFITVLIGLVMLAALLLLFIRMGKNETLDDDNPEKMWFAKTAAPAEATAAAEPDDSSAPLPPLTEEQAAAELQQLQDKPAQPEPQPEPKPE